MVEGRSRNIVLAIALLVSMPALAQTFTPGNLVVAVEGCGVHGGTCTNIQNGTGDGTGNSSVGGYGDNQAAPLTLFQYSPNGTASVSFVNSLVLPQTLAGANAPVSGEYGSSSEATLQLSGPGQYLTILGYGIDVASFNANPATYGAAPSNALAQSGSLTGQSYTAVPRVLTLIDANGNVNSSTAIYNIFNTNNPRSAYTSDGSTAYVSGQGSGADATGGVFLTPIGAINNAPTAITGLDTSGKTIAQDTREVQIINNTLYVSVDSKEGSGSNRDFIGTLGSPPATSLFNSGNGPTQLTNFAASGAGKETMTTGANGNGNNLNAGAKINLSPVNFFFASPSVLYVADSGDPKNDSNGDNNSTGTASIGDGGLQKWINSAADGSGTWNLAYTLYQGLNLVNNGSADGTSGLYGLAGTVSGNNVLLYATNYTLSDLDQTYLYGITDNLTYTTASQAASETFTLLDTAPPDSNFKGVSFAPTIPNGDVEVTSSPSGLSVTSSGTGCAPATFTTPLTLTWTPASNCTLSVVTPQSGAAGVQYAFDQWQDGTTSTTDSVTAPSTTATYTASFTTEYQLTTSAGTGGSISPGAYIPAGTDAMITATPSAGYYFVNFTGAVTSTDNPLSLLMDAPKSITANFAPQMSQTITCTQNAPSSATYDTNFTVVCSASSGLDVTYASGGACSNSGGMYTMTSGTGTCSVMVSQAGDDQYSAAPMFTQTVNATQASQSITVTTPAPPTATLKSSFTVVATSTSGLPVAFGSSGGCTNVGATYTMAPTGSKACIVTMNVAASSNYSAAPQITESTSVAKPITPTVSFTGAPATALYQASFMVSASSNSTSAPTFTTTGPCTINSATLVVMMTSGTGTCAMTATWAANDVYAKATAVQRTTAEKVASVITWSNPAAITYGTPLSSTQLNATANTSGTFVYTPPSGRILKAGLQSLSVRFIPSSTTDYTTVTDDVDLTVNPVNTTTTITSNTPNPSNTGRVVTFDFSVAQAITNPTKPTGTVMVNASTGESCSGKVGGGKGNCKITFTSSGPRTVSASYSGDANNNSSVSDSVTQTVN
jgi:Divergent InlB B-repeat domain/Bacterial Ig-like domain (group 3)